MPQMSPLMWLFLMIMIVMVYCFFMVVNYFICQTSDSGKTEFSNISHQKDWRW